MKDLGTYMVLIILTSLIVRRKSQSIPEDLGYSEYGSDPTTDWSNVIPNLTTRKPLFPQRTTQEDYGEYYDFGDDEGKPRILLAQGPYMMLSMPGYDDCGLVGVFKGTFKEINERLCIMTANPEWWWIFDFPDDTENKVLAYDRSNAKLLETTFQSLPKQPPDIVYTSIQSGAGWMQVKVRVAEEGLPNLVGIEILYKRPEDETWWRSYIESVSYTGYLPHVVPVHFCPDYNEDGTYCALLTDGVWTKDEKEARATYTFKITPFRIGPYERTFGQPTDLTHTYGYCDWLLSNCNPPMGQTDEDEDYEDEVDVYDYGDYDNAGNGTGTAPVPTDTTTINGSTPVQKFLISTTWAPEMWLEDTTEKRPSIIVVEADLWILYVALLLILICILLPLAFWLGTRAGYKEAERYWSELSSTGGNVNIALGYVGTEWTRPPPTSNI